MSTEQKRPKASRAEKTVRSNSRALLIASLALLAGCMAMTALFGWSLGASMVDKVVYAIALAAVDVGGAAAISHAATAMAVRAWASATVGLLAACVAFSLTLAGILGFQGGNREAQAQGRERAAKIDTDQLEWLRGQTTIAGKQDKQTMLAEVKDQIKALKGNADLPDALSAVVAPLLGVPEATARRSSLVWISIGLLMAQYFFVWLYGSARHRIEPAVAAKSLMAGGISKFSNGRSGRTTEGAYSVQRAREDIDELVRGGFDAMARGAITFLATRWQWPHNSTGRWLRANGYLPRKEAKRKPPVERGENFAINGNGHARTI